MPKLNPKIKLLLLAILVSGFLGLNNKSFGADSNLLLHCGMESREEINSPVFAAKKITNWENGAAVWEGASGNGVVFESGQSGLAARLNGNSWNSIENVIFDAANFDFSDEALDGGELSFWLKFNVDPHIYTGNKFIHL